MALHGSVLALHVLAGFGFGFGFWLLLVSVSAGGSTSCVQVAGPKSYRHVSASSSPPYTYLGKRAGRLRLRESERESERRRQQLEAFSVMNVHGVADGDGAVERTL